MLAASISFIACAEPLSFTWYAFWRLISGITGGMLMTIGPTLVLAVTPPKRQGLVGGLLFAGVASGIVISGVLLPILLSISLSAGWLGIGVLGLVLTRLSWRSWPGITMPVETTRMPIRRFSLAIFGLFLCYAFSAFAIVPHMMFFVDWIARGLGKGLNVGASYWVLFGMSGMIGPSLIGLCADKIGSRLALHVGFAAMIVGNGLIVLWDSPLAITASALLMGTMIPAIAVLTLNRVQDLTREDTGVATAGLGPGDHRVRFHAGSLGLHLFLSVLQLRLRRQLPHHFSSRRWGSHPCGDCRSRIGSSNQAVVRIIETPHFVQAAGRTNKGSRAIANRINIFRFAIDG